MTGVGYSARREDYELLAAIGVGEVSEVWQALYKPTSELVAVKIVDLEQYEKDFDTVRKEIMVMSQNSHPNIVAYHTSFIVETSLWLVMELLAGSMQDLLRFKFADGMVPHAEELAFAILKQVLLGLDYIHGQGLIHRDLKSSNILFDRRGRVRIGDFGVSAVLNESSGDRRKKGYTFVGTPQIMAPEVMEQTSGYDNKADIWSFGILAYELATGHPPYHNESPMKVMFLVLQHDPPNLDERASSAYRDLVKLSLVRDPEKRASANRMLNECKAAKGVKNPEEVVRSFLESEPMLVDQVQAHWNGPMLREQLENKRRSQGKSEVKRDVEAKPSWDFDDVEDAKLKPQDREKSERADLKIDLKKEVKEKDDDSLQGSTNPSSTTQKGRFKIQALDSHTPPISPPPGVQDADMSDRGGDREKKEEKVDKVAPVEKEKDRDPREHTSPQPSPFAQSGSGVPPLNPVVSPPKDNGSGAANALPGTGVLPATLEKRQSRFTIKEVAVDEHAPKEPKDTSAAAAAKEREREKEHQKDKLKHDKDAALHLLLERSEQQGKILQHLMTVLAREQELEKRIAELSAENEALRQQVAELQKL